MTTLDELQQWRNRMGDNQQQVAAMLEIALMLRSAFDDLGQFHADEFLAIG
jgi:hypothetical protein